MKGILSKTILFATGAAIGSFVTWKVLESRYRKLVQEEVDSVKEELSKYYGVPTVKKEEETEAESDMSLEEYADMVLENSYAPAHVDYSKVLEKDTEVSDEMEKPYVITSEAFGELYDYETITLNHYADGVLTDDQDEIIDNPEDIVGDDYIECFGTNEDEPDTVYVRNDKLRCDYEILLNCETYSGIPE